MVEWFNISVRCSIWSLFCFPLLTSQQVTISQHNVVVRLNEIVNLTCNTNIKTPIKSCLWEINGELYNLGFGSRYDLLGDLENGECGIRVAKITEEESGVWICRVFLKNNQKNTTRGREIKDSANVTVVALPKISIMSDGRELGNFINVIADEKEKEINCSTINARPVPTIRWILGDELIPSDRQETFVIDRNVNGKVNVTSALKYVFQSSDHGKLLRCVITDHWILKDDPHETNTTLNVTFVPQPEEEITLYGFVLGQPGNITLDFTASTRPSSVLWNIDNETELVIESSKNRSTLIHNSDNFQVSELNNLNDTLYEVRLKIVSVREEDFNRLYRLVVEWENINVTQEYLVRISTDQLPKNIQINSASAATVTRHTSAAAFALILAAVIFYALKFRRL